MNLRAKDYNIETDRSPHDSQWDILTEEVFQKKNHLTQDQMRLRIKEGIERYKESIQPFVDKVDDDTLKTFIKEYEEDDYPLFAIDQGFLHMLESVLKLKNKIDLWHDEDPNKKAGAYYQRGKNTIIINDNFTKDTGDAFDFIEELSGLAHEVFHAYQYEQKIYGDRESSERYRNLFSSYTTKDCISYCDNPIELEAYCFQDLIGRKILKNMHQMGRHTDLGIH